MSSTVTSRLRAWEPLTPRGVAAFAGARFTRLLLVQIIVASLAAASVVWFLEEFWFPEVRVAIHHLPAQGSIHNEQLDWSGDSPVQLSGNHFLGWAVDLNHSGQLGRSAQLQVEFGRRDLRIYSLVGYEVIPYPPGMSIAFNRTELEPWWGAWEPAILAGAAAGTLLGLMATWVLLATIYCVPIRLITFFEDRDINWWRSWKLAAAALLPGALFMISGIAAYGFNLIDLVHLGGVAVLHFVVGWIYLYVSPLFLPRLPAAPPLKSNPFLSKAGEKPAAETRPGGEA